LIEQARKNNVISEFSIRNVARRRVPRQGIHFISVGNDLHHVLTQTGAYVNDIENVSKEKGKAWKRRPTALF